MRVRNKKNQFISLFIKVAILFLLVFALYKQLIGNTEVQSALLLMQHSVSAKGFLIMGLAFGLMVFNWSLEAYKWQLLVSKLLYIRFVRAFKAVWTGVTLGLFTPNRIGEYGGRILYLPMRFRIRGIVVSLIGSFSQIVVTACIGIGALVIFLLSENVFENYLTWILLALSILLAILLILAYLNLHIFIDLFNRNKFFRRVLPYLAVLNAYHLSDYGKFIMLSLFRYMVFSAQYLVFLNLFGVQIGFGNSVLAVSLIFLAQTIIPSFAVAELFTRGNIALYFFGFYTDSVIGVFAASTSLWLLNLILPAVLGYIFIMRKNIIKGTTND